MAQRDRPIPAVIGGPEAPESAEYFFLSELLGSRVRADGSSSSLGRLTDIGAVAASAFPEAVCLQVGSRGGSTLVPWTAVSRLSMREILVREGAAPARGDPPAGCPAPSFWLRRDVLDDQVIDLSGAKVIRVNDVHMLHAEGKLILAHVDVGILGILRRLGYARLFSRLLDWLFDYVLKEKFVSWRHVQLIGPEGTAPAIRLSKTASRLAGIHPAELADILEQLGVQERETIFRSLSIETAADALEEVDPEFQRAFFAQEEPGKAADLLEEMPATEAADVLRDLHDSDAERIMSRMESDAAASIREILSHEEKSAGGVMSTGCIETRPDGRAGEVFEEIRRVVDDVEVFNQIYVLDPERRLLGVLSLREILRAPPGARLDSLMTTDIVKVEPETSLPDVARIFVKYGFRAVPVVDERGIFLGAVRLINVLAKLSRFFRD